MIDAQITVTVDGMTEDSEATIHRALIRINGVEKVIVNVKNKKVFIEFDDEKITEQLIQETIEDEGFIVKT